MPPGLPSSEPSLLYAAPVFWHLAGRGVYRRMGVWAYRRGRAEAQPGIIGGWDQPSPAAAGLRRGKLYAIHDAYEPLSLVP